MNTQPRGNTYDTPRGHQSQIGLRFQCPTNRTASPPEDINRTANDGLHIQSFTHSFFLNPPHSTTSKRHFRSVLNHSVTSAHPNLSPSPHTQTCSSFMVLYIHRNMDMLPGVSKALAGCMRSGRWLVVTELSVEEVLNRYARVHTSRYRQR